MPVPQQPPPLPRLGEPCGSRSWVAGEPVWVWVGGVWRPGVVVAVSVVAAMVRYRLAGGVGYGVDTVTCGYLAVRVEPDAVDEAGRSPPVRGGPLSGL